MNENKPLLSVIIPVYKVEKYLNRCVKSVTSQPFQQIEVILVDDGSPDQCPQICDELASHDSRIRVIHKPNGGLSTARNAGLEIATGEYVAFLDSDDVWIDGKLSSIMNVVLNVKTEFFMFMSYDMTPVGIIYKRKDMQSFFMGKEIQSFDTRTYYEHLLRDGNFHESACTKILSRSFLLENQLFFQPNIISEDTEWMIRVLRYTRKVVVINIPLFVYTLNRVGSISNSTNERMLNGLLTIISQCIQYNQECMNDLFSFEFAHCAYLLSIAYGIYPKLKIKVRKPYKERLISLAYLFDYNDGRKVKLVRKAYHLFGFSLCTKVLSFYIRLNKRINICRKKNDGQEIKGASFSC